MTWFLTRAGRRRPAGRVALMAIAGAVLASACTVGPNYKRPPIDAPAAYRGAAENGSDGTGASSSIADEQWSAIFEDDALQGLIARALARGYDVQIAAARVLEAQARLGIVRSDQFPSVSAGASAIGQRTSSALGFPSRTVGTVAVEGTAAWQLDFWGRYRRATEAARADLLASEWGRRAVMTTLVSEVAGGYFRLRTLDLSLDVSRRTLESRQESLRLTQVREQGGVTTLVDVRQAEQLVYEATGEIATLERQIEQEENFLSVLVGDNPGSIARGRSLTDQPQPPAIPAGLPSALLERRPDIQAAEQQLASANAQIGVARSAYFPSIGLTASGGVESSALSALFTGAGALWSTAASLAQPIFTAGRTRSQVAVAEARRQQALLEYQQTIRQAFREVSDALVGYRKLREFREQQGLLLASAEDARRLADVRYRGGATSYLEVLDADTRRFNAELGLADARFQELSALVEIYRALGGGWE
jgi:multidrug efflux system outer membrane protein